MPITLTKIANDTASVTFPYSGESVTVEYLPSKVTEKTFKQLQVFSQISDVTIIDSFGALNDMLVSLVKSWDVFEDDGQQVMFPLSVDRLPELPIMFRATVLKAILGDIRPEALAPQA